MTLNKPVWANNHDSDSEDENDYDGYNANRGYWAYSCELMRRWFCRFCQRKKRANVSQMVLVILAFASIAQSYEVQFHTHAGRKMAYRYVAATTPTPAVANILCIHPVGIGISSWFFDKLNADLPSCNVLSPDLRGCGDSEAFVPEEDGMFFPLDWTRQVEELCKELSWGESLPVVILAQGGIAPVALQLGYRGKLENIQRIILTSPPTYETLTKPISADEYGLNYNILTFPGLKQIFTRILMNRGAIKFFSNLFLFSQSADEDFLSKAARDAEQLWRINPVFAFNAGALITRSWEEEIESCGKLGLVIISGEKETEERRLGRDFGSNCTNVILEDGLNVIPWEQSRALASIIMNE
ncbi:hypothetical protein TrST_g1829 [Triparma strigata]|uniref:AB hydrolase-1 domain-containing protein n=1 Tax=Triparma strigata TaxID=1606541 RepID=A0A9W7BXM5_9STRA|nr:hypothetical protein TrST_g1829 [Triparma strigata]